MILMLCCSVQCENNENYVEMIRAMDNSNQLELMTCINEVCVAVTAPHNHHCRAWCCMRLE